MATGPVKWFNESKGFGFISRDDGGAAVFVHFGAITGSGLKTQAGVKKVSFEIQQGPKGPQAATLSADEATPVERKNRCGGGRSRSERRSYGKRGRGAERLLFPDTKKPAEAGFSVLARLLIQQRR